MPVDQEFGFGWKVRKKLCTQIGAVVSPTTTMPLKTAQSSPWIQTSTLAGSTILVEKITGMETAGHCMHCVRFCQPNYKNFPLHSTSFISASNRESVLYSSVIIVPLEFYENQLHFWPDWSPLPWLGQIGQQAAFLCRQLRFRPSSPLLHTRSIELIGRHSPNKVNESDFCSDSLFQQTEK